MAAYHENLTDELECWYGAIERFQECVRKDINREGQDG